MGVKKKRFRLMKNDQKMRDWLKIWRFWGSLEKSWWCSSYFKDSTVDPSFPELHHVKGMQECPGKIMSERTFDPVFNYPWFIIELLNHFEIWQNKSLMVKCPQHWILNHHVFDIHWTARFTKATIFMQSFRWTPPLNDNMRGYVFKINAFHLWFHRFR